MLLVIAGRKNKFCVCSAMERLWNRGQTVMKKSNDLICINLFKMILSYELYGRKSQTLDLFIVVIVIGSLRFNKKFMIFFLYISPKCLIPIRVDGALIIFTLAETSPYARPVLMLPLSFGAKSQYTLTRAQSPHMHVELSVRKKKTKPKKDVAITNPNRNYSLR